MNKTCEVNPAYCCEYNGQCEDCRKRGEMNEKKQDFKYFKPMGDGSGFLLDVNKKPIYQSADCINCCLNIAKHLQK